MNFYEIFYWITVADSVKSFFDVMSDIATWFFVIGTIGFIIITGVKIVDCPTEYFKTKDGKYPLDENNNPIYTKVEDQSFKTTRKIIQFFFYFSCVFLIISWAGYVFTPTKKDGLLIVAAGGTLEFISSDSTAKQIPHDLANFVSSELKTMAKEAQVELKGLNDKETLVNELNSLTKEELIEKLKTDSIARKLILE